jgi:hypothetical protein
LKIEMMFLRLIGPDVLIIGLLIGVVTLALTIGVVAVLVKALRSQGGSRSDNDKHHT